MAIPHDATARHDFHRVFDIEEAAAIETEEGFAFYPDKDSYIRALRDGKAGPVRHEFRYRKSKEQKFISNAFRYRAAFCQQNPTHPIAFVIGCFEERRRLHQLLRPSCPLFHEEFAGYVTRNLKEAATILRTGAGHPQPTETNFIRRRENHFVFQFEHTPAVHEIHDAFAKPDVFVAANRDHWLAYVVRSMFLREVLAKRLHEIPVQRIERKAGKKFTTIKVIPEKTHAR
jgi:hypothetical protein